MCKRQLVLTVSVRFPAVKLFVVRKLTVGMKTTELQYKPQIPAGDAQIYVAGTQIHPTDPSQCNTTH